MVRFLTSSIVIIIVLTLATISLVLLYLQGRMTAVWVGAGLLLLSLLLILLGGSPGDSARGGSRNDSDY